MSNCPNKQKLQKIYQASAQQEFEYRVYNTFIQSIVFALIPIKINQQGFFGAVYNDEIAIACWCLICLCVAIKNFVFFQASDVYAIYLYEDHLALTYSSDFLFFTVRKHKMAYWNDLEKINFSVSEASGRLFSRKQESLSFYLIDNEDFRLDVLGGESLEQICKELNQELIAYRQLVFKEAKLKINLLGEQDKNFRSWVKNYNLQIRTVQPLAYCLNIYKKSINIIINFNARQAIYKKHANKEVLALLQKPEEKKQVFASVETSVLAADGSTQAVSTLSIFFSLSKDNIYEIWLNNCEQDRQIFYLPPEAFHAWLGRENRKAEQINKNFWQQNALLAEKLNIYPIDIAAGLFIQYLGKFFWNCVGKAIDFDYEKQITF